jgi:hypothetical protein
MITTTFIFVSKVNIIITINDHHWSPLIVNSHRGDRAAQTDITQKKRAYFCIFLHIFAYFLHIFAYFCLSV